MISEMAAPGVEWLAELLDPRYPSPSSTDDNCKTPVKFRGPGKCDPPLHLDSLTGIPTWPGHALAFVMARTNDLDPTQYCDMLDSEFRQPSDEDYTPIDKVRRVFRDLWYGVP